jgi:hypothetical protein
MNNRDILSKPFSGSIDELLKFTQENADFVEDVVVNDKDILLSDTESIGMIKEMTNYEISDEEARKMLDEIKMEAVRESINKLIEEGLVEVKSYDDNGEPLYGLTAAGDKTADEIKNRTN